MSDEFFTLVEGKKVDAPMHDPILRNAEAHATVREISKQVMRDQGYSEDQIVLLLTSKAVLGN